MGQSEYHLQIRKVPNEYDATGITKSISNSRDFKKNAMAQKNAQLCWIQKHTEEICNPLSGPSKKLKLTVYQMEEAWKE
ncbi:Glycerol kinase [Trichinella pseudospiralis]